MLFLILAGVYAITFWVVGLSKPWLSLAVICGTIFFQQDLSAGGGPVRFAFAEINLILAIPIAAFSDKRLRSYPGMIPAVIYLTLCIFPSLVVWRGDTVISVIQMVIYLIIAPIVFASLGRTGPACKKALNATVLVGSLMAIAPVVLRSSYVFGLNKNGLGSTLCAALLVAVELRFQEQSPRARKWYSVAIAIISLGLMATFSRGSWLGALVGLSALALWRGHFLRLVRVGLLLLPILVILWWKLPQGPKENATNFSTEAYNIRARIDMIDYAWTQFRSAPVFGVGVGLRKEYDCTNIILSTAAESGVIGLGAFLSIFITMFIFFWRVRRWLPQQGIASSAVALAVALNAAKLMHGLVDHYWTRGSITLAWGMVGMAAALASETRRKMILLRILQEQEELQAPSPVSA